MAVASPLVSIDGLSSPASALAARLAPLGRGLRHPDLALILLLAGIVIGAWALFAATLPPVLDGIDLLGPAVGLAALTGALALLATTVIRLRRRAAQSAHGHAQALVQAHAASRSKTEFLANMSHELRTPLNAVIGYAELLATEIPGALGAKQADYVELIRRSGTHLLDLVTEILDLAKIQTGRLEIHPAPVAARDIVESCALLVRERIAATGLRLIVDPAADLPRITVDAARLKQVLLSLLSNAMKFTPAGGTVGLVGRVTAAGGVAFTVSDTGSGMTDAEIALALEVFGQVDGGLERSHDGTGLGLPLARRLTELHGGTLEIESLKGRGTTVTVTLPPARVGDRAATPAVA